MDGGTTEVIKTAIQTSCAAGTFITAIISFTVLRLKGGKQKATDATTTRMEQEIAGLKQEVAELRDTATRYDLSFDTALQRIDRRVDHLEGVISDDSASVQSGKLVIRT